MARADRTEARERPADGAAAGTRGTSVSERGGATQAQARGPGSAPARSEDGGDRTARGDAPSVGVPLHSFHAKKPSSTSKVRLSAFHWVALIRFREKAHATFSAQAHASFAVPVDRRARSN